MTLLITEPIEWLDDLLKRKVLNEQEFAKANEASIAEKEGLESRKSELEVIVSRKQDRTSLADSLPRIIACFLKAFEGRHPPADGQPQGILKSATVYRDDRLELAFRD